MKQPIPFGKYLLLERINVGGMAEIFLARSRGVHGFKRILAIKKILPTMAEDSEFIAMFIDEARIAAELSHAGIVQIFELGKFEEDYYIAMEFVHGKDLRFIQERMLRERTPMPIANAAHITYKILEALDYAHIRKDPMGRPLGIIHRDVSPQNVITSFEGEVKICDFGIAKAANRSQKTQAGVLKGKFGYMSPEQVRGLPLDGRSDLFTVGTLLYEMVTLERLFVGESDFSTLEKVRNADVVPPSTYNREVPEELEDIILRALSKEVEDRFQNAAEFADSLQAFMLKSELVRPRDLAIFIRDVFSAEYEAEIHRLEKYEKLPETIALIADDDDEVIEVGDEDLEDVDLEGKTLIFASRDIEQRDKLQSTPPPVPSTSQSVGKSSAGPASAGKAEIADASTMIFSDAEVNSELAGAQSSQSPVVADAQTMIFADPEIQPDDDIHELPTRGLIDRPDLSVLETKRPVKTRSFADRFFLPLATIAALLLGWSIFVTFRLTQSQPITSKSAFELVTVPATGLKVFIDEAEVASVTPYTTTDLALGSHRLKITRPGYRDLKREIEIRVGSRLILEASLAPLDRPATDSKGPIKRDPLVSDPAIKKTLDGGIASTEGKHDKPPDDVKPTEFVVVSKPKGAFVSLNGKKIGTTPFRTSKFKASKSARVTIVLKGYKTANRTIDIKEHQKNKVEVVLVKIRKPVIRPPKDPKRPIKKQYGFLVANTRPWSKVYIDGKYSGRETPIAPDKKLKLTAGKHKVIFETPGGKRFVFEVMIEPGKVLKLIKRLEG
ncbi:MAG: serine/threonine protein kinase [Deltaproteobacteria bacterium]|nr:serine/threonine protein kinase [Deltaproteobacteria bacterium]